MDNGDGLRTNPQEGPAAGRPTPTRLREVPVELCEGYVSTLYMLSFEDEDHR